MNNLFVPSLYLFVPWQFVCVLIPVGHRIYMYIISAKKEITVISLTIRLLYIIHIEEKLF